MSKSSALANADEYFQPLFGDLDILNRTVNTEIRAVKKAPNQSTIGDAIHQGRSYSASESVSLWGSSTARYSEGEVVYIGNFYGSIKLDEIRGVVRSFDELTEGWDGPDSARPIPGVISDALEVLQNWMNDLDIPEPALAFDGTIALELYDDLGFTRGGVEFIGKHQAVYSVVSQSKLIDSGTFDAANPGEIISGLAKIRRALPAA